MGSCRRAPKFSRIWKVCRVFALGNEASICSFKGPQTIEQSNNSRSLVGSASSQSFSGVTTGKVLIKTRGYVRRAHGSERAHVAENPQVQFRTMVPDGPDILGVEFIKLLNQEVQEQARLELILGDGEQQLEEYHKAAEPLWKKIKKHVKGEKAFPFIQETFYQDRKEITKPMARGVLLKLLKNSKYQPAWKLAKLLVHEKPFKLDEMDYVFQLAFAALAGHLVVAEDLFASLPPGYKTRKAYYVLLGGYAKWKKRVRLQRLVKEMTELGLYTEPFALNQVLLLHDEPHLRTRIPGLFEEAKSLGIAPDVCSYNIYIGNYSKEGRICNMEEAFELLRADPDVKPNESTYFIVACGYISGGHFQNAGRILVELEESIESGLFKRKQATYNKLLRLYGDTKDRAGVEKMWEILSSRPLNATDSYSYAIEAFGKVDGVYRAEEIFARTDGLLQTRKVISMMTVYTSQGYMDKAKELFHHLPRKNMKLRAIVYQRMISGYLKDRQVKKAMDAFRMGQTVLGDKCTSKVWYETLLTILTHFADEGDVVGAEKCFKYCNAAKQHRDIRMLRILLRAYINGRTPIKGFFRRIVRSGLSPDPETRQLLRELQTKK